VFVDEGTSHLDVALERRVNAAIRSLGLTRIIIAHRPETVASASRVLVLSRDCVAEYLPYHHRPALGGERALKPASRRPPA
jgi:ATP-binding cassette subfamily B protein RaxB